MSNTNIECLLIPYSAYPKPIRPFLLRADTHPILRSLLTKSGMALLIDILGRAPIHDPNRSLKLRVDKLASTINCSEKTVQRVLNILQGKGWLTRSPNHDGRNYRGRFSHREFVMGNELRELVGLPMEKCSQTKMSDGEMISMDKGIKNTENSVDNLVFQTKMSDGHKGVNKVFKKEALKEASCENSEPQKTKGEGKLPVDLEELQTTLKLSVGGVCTLMRLALQHRQRLQEVWSAKKSSLLKAGVTEGRAFHYLKSLLLSGEDFAFVGKQQRRLAQDAAIDQKSLDRRCYWHKRYKGGNGVTVRIFDGTAEVSRGVLDSRFVIAADMQSIYEAIEAGQLREIVE